MSKPTLPNPTVNMNETSEEWTEGDIRAMFCNPLYAGVGPFPAMVDDEMWVMAAAKSIRDEGPEQWLVNLLAVLRFHLESDPEDEPRSKN